MLFQTKKDKKNKNEKNKQYLAYIWLLYSRAAIVQQGSHSRKNLCKSRIKT